MLLTKKGMIKNPLKACLYGWKQTGKQFLKEGISKSLSLLPLRTIKGYLVEGAHVYFFAEAFEAGERDGQLSQSEITTDETGQARVTYTTLATDDQRFVTIRISVGKDVGDDYIEEFGELQIIAADRASKVNGVVTDPFTGAPLEGICVHFQRYDLNRKSIGFTETDAKGCYAATVPTGHYGISFEEMEIRDEIAVNISNPGEGYTVNNNKGILKGIVTGVSPGKQVMAIGPGFRSTNQANWTLQAEIQSDGSFILSLFPNTYELMIVDPKRPPSF